MDQTRRSTLKTLTALGATLLCEPLSAALLTSDPTIIIDTHNAHQKAKDINGKTYLLKVPMIIDGENEEVWVKDTVFKIQHNFGNAEYLQFINCKHLNMTRVTINPDKMQDSPPGHQIHHFHNGVGFSLAT